MQLEMKKQLRMFGIGFLCALILSVTFVYSQTVLTPMTLTKGIYPAAPSYTIWKEGSTYYAKNAYGVLDYSGVNSTIIVQTVENIVDDNGGTIYLKDMQMPSGVSISDNVLILEFYQGGVKWFYTNRVGNLLSDFSDIPRPFAVNCGGQMEQQNRPAGVYVNNRTYVVYPTNPGLHPCVQAYNHITNLWSEPVTVGTTPVAVAGDGHATPCIINDALGYLHVFYGCHDSFTFGIRHSKSNNPYDHTSWTEQADLLQSSYCTYPNVVRDSSGVLWLVYRDTTLGYYSARTTYIKSTDNGATWSSPRYIIGSFSSITIWQAAIWLEEGATQKIHIIWTIYDSGVGRRQNVQHAYLNCGNDKMYSQSGVDMGATIDKTENDANCIVYNSGSTNSMAEHIFFSSNSTPFILYTAEGATNKFYYQIKRWTGAAWSSAVNITSSIYFYPSFNTGNIIVEGTSNITAYLSMPSLARLGVPNEQFAGDIVQFVSHDSGVTWKCKGIIASGLMWGNPLYDPEVIGFGYNDRNPDLKIVFTTLNNWYNGAWSTEALMPIFAWGDSGFP